MDKRDTQTYDAKALKEALALKQGSDEIRDGLFKVYIALIEGNYEENSMGQIAGYIISGDPSYITSKGGARNLINQFDRYDILVELLNSYLLGK